MNNNNIPTTTLLLRLSLLVAVTLVVAAADERLSAAAAADVAVVAGHPGGPAAGGHHHAGGPDGHAAEGSTEASVEATTEDTTGRLLKLPVPKKCAERPVHFTHGNHSYFYSDRLPEYNKKKFDWLEGRNECREYCMDLVSIETPSEDDMVREFIKKGESSLLLIAWFYSNQI
jgi:hypothetical protein